MITREYVFRYYSPAHFSEWFRRFYGPITRLAGTLSPAAVGSEGCMLPGRP